MESQPELLGDVISCWMTLGRFSKLLDLPTMSLACFEEVLVGTKPTMMCHKLHITLLQLLVDSKQLDYNAHLALDDVTWPHHLALAIQAAEKFKASRSTPQKQQEVLQRLVQLIHPNREKKPSEYYLSHALLDLVGIARKVHGGEPLSESEFRTQVLAAIEPIDRRRPGDGILPSEYFVEQCVAVEQGRSTDDSILGAACDALLVSDYEKVSLAYRLAVLMWLCNEVCASLRQGAEWC